MLVGRPNCGRHLVIRNAKVPAGVKYTVLYSLYCSHSSSTVADIAITSSIDQLSYSPFKLNTLDQDSDIYSDPSINPGRQASHPTVSTSLLLLTHRLHFLQLVQRPLTSLGLFASFVTSILISLILSLIAVLRLSFLALLSS